jgi:hypothetical protein
MSSDCTSPRTSPGLISGRPPGRGFSLQNKGSNLAPLSTPGATPGATPGRPSPRITWGDPGALQNKRPNLAPVRTSPSRARTPLHYSLSRTGATLTQPHYRVVADDHRPRLRLGRAPVDPFTRSAVAKVNTLSLSPLNTTGCAGVPEGLARREREARVTHEQNTFTRSMCSTTTNTTTTNTTTTRRIHDTTTRHESRTHSGANGEQPWEAREVPEFVAASNLGRSRGGLYQRPDRDRVIRAHSPSENTTTTPQSAKNTHLPLLGLRRLRLYASSCWRPSSHHAGTGAAFGLQAGTGDRSPVKGCSHEDPPRAEDSRSESEYSKRRGTMTSPWGDAPLMAPLEIGR